MNNPVELLPTIVKPRIVMYVSAPHSAKGVSVCTEPLPLAFSVAPLPSNVRWWRLVSLIPWSSRYLLPALNTMVDPSGTFAIHAFNAALASDAPVESIDEGTASPFVGFGVGVGGSGPMWAAEVAASSKTASST